MGDPDALPAQRARPEAERARHRFAAAAATTYGASIVGAGLALGNVLVTSRALGPGGRGELAFLTTVAMLTATLATLGLEEATANLAGAQPETRPALGANALLLALVLGAAGALVVAGLVTVFPDAGGHASRPLLWLALGVVPVIVLQTTLLFLVRADYGFGVANLATVAAPVATVATNTTLVVLDRISVATAFAVWVVAQCASTSLLGWYVASRLAGFGRPDLGLAARSLRFGVKAHVGRVMKSGNYRLDQWLLGSMAGSRELGLYSVAVAWSEALFYVPDALGLVMRPDLVRASPEQAARRGALAFRVAVIVTVPLVVVLVLAAPFLCVTIFGEAFGGSVDDLRVLAPGAFGMVALKLLANALTAQGKPMLGNVAVAVAFATTIALDVLLIPHHGGRGAAVASTAAYTAGGIAVAVVFTRSLRSSLGSLLPQRGDLGRIVEPIRALVR